MSIIIELFLLQKKSSQNETVKVLCKIEDVVFRGDQVIRVLNC